MFAVTSQSPEIELALGIEELEPMEAPALWEYVVGVAVGLGVGIAVGIAIT